MDLPKPQKCEECGDASVYHGLTYFTVLVDTFISRVLPSPSNGFTRRVEKWFENFITPYMSRFFAWIGVAKMIAKPDDQTLSLGVAVWEEAERRDIKVWEWRLFGLPRNMFLAKLPSGKWISYEGFPTASYDYKRKLWMDDKARMKKEFIKEAFPVAKGGSAASEKVALKLFHSLTPPVITKPHTGSRSRHTTLHITNDEELLHGFRVGKQLSPRVIIEEEFMGPVHCATVVNGKFVASIRREAAHVVGDGVHTVRELVEEENKNPLRDGPYYAKLQLDEKALQELSWQHLTPDSVVEKGKWAQLNQKVNWGFGGVAVDVTDVMHPDNVALFENVAKVLCAPVVGLDFIIQDCTRSWKEQEHCGILECNSMPFFEDHLHPFTGKPRNVAAHVWDMIYNPSQQPRQTV